MTNAVQFTSIPTALIKVDGVPVPDEVLAMLLDVRVELELNGVSQATVRCFDPQFEILDSATFDPGSSITIAFGDHTDAMTEVFSGEVVTIGVEQGPKDGHELVVTCFDLAHRLGRSTEARTYQNVTYGDVVRQIAGRHGLRATVPGGFPTTMHPYLLQMTDDAAFLSELVRRAGAQWRIDAQKLVVTMLTQAQPVAEVTFGQNLLRFRSHLNLAATTDEITTLGWDPLTKRNITVAARPHAGPGLSAPGGLTNGRPSGKALPKAKRFGSRQVFTSTEEATMVAAALRLEADALAVNARGETYGNPVLVPGSTVSVKGVGTRMSGNYFLTATEHIYSVVNGYVTRFTTGPLSGASVPDLVGAGSAPTTHLSPVVGIVTNNKDTSRQGVVRVSFPTFGANIESAWARVIGLGAGASRGLLMLPAVNDEVLVVFEGGDYRRPVVIGGLWNGRDTPQIPSATTTKQGEVVQWAITTGKDQQLLFDSSDPQKISVTVAVDDAALTKLYVGKDKVELFANRKTIQLKTGQADVLLDGQSNDVTINANNITLNARQSVKITANATVEIKGTAQAKLNGTSVEVKGTAALMLGASGTPTVLAGTPVKIN